MSQDQTQGQRTDPTHGDVVMAVRRAIIRAADASSSTSDVNALASIVSAYQSLEDFLEPPHA